MLKRLNILVTFITKNKVGSKTQHEFEFVSEKLTKHAHWVVTNSLGVHHGNGF